jgi:uncharacterized membrane protein
MIELISRFNRFMMSQSFYPILLSSILAMSIFMVRVFISRSLHIYSNLVWNLFLAWIPYLFSMQAAALYFVFPRQWWMLIVPGGIWLAFFPNAPYIVTDFLHLVNHPHIPLWYDILLLTTFSWTGVFLAIASLRTMQALIKIHLGNILSWFFVIVSLSLCGLGLYLGRFNRWNSWDLLIHPKTILKDIAIQVINPLDNLSFFGFTIIFIFFLFISYLMFTSILQFEDQTHNTGIKKHHEKSYHNLIRLAIFIMGFFLIILSLGVDVIGFGETNIFGWKQILTITLGIIFIILGLYLSIKIQINTRAIRSSIK